jgi:glyoxylase-like metal-dependent hydrolase (beta-lactamase superfamily II)
MASQPIWIGIVIAAFFVGLGGTYLIFHTGNSDVNENFNMMMNDPEMQKMIMTTMQDSNQIQLMEDMMDDMMKRMQTDPELKQAMMEHMATMKSSRDAMMDSGMNQGMMDNSQVSASMFEIHPEKMRTSAPLPDIAKGPQIDYSKGYLVEEVRDGLYWVTDGAYNTMFLTTGQGVIVVDAPPSIGENYLKAIAEVTEEPVTHVIYSHTHNDHVGSINMFPDDATYISHQEVADTLAKRNDPNRPIPSVTFEEKYTLEVGNQILELEYAGPMHESGNIFIYAPQQKVLMLVDVVFPGWTPFKDLAMAQDVLEFLAAHDKILEYDFDTYIGGHLTRLGTVEDVEIQKEYFQDIQASAGKANQEVSFMAIGQEVGFSNPWLVFQIYADQITQQCTDEVVPKWIDRLGGVDLFTYDHCWKISEAQRID